MKCDECGTENLEGSTFCKKCGKSFMEEDKLIEDNPPTKIKEATNTNSNTNIVHDVYCECGQILKKDWNYCPNCKTPISEDVKKTISSEQNEDTNNDNAYIYVILFFISVVSSFFLNFYWGLIIAIVVIITGLINNPNNKIIRTIFTVSIVFFILYIIFFIWLIVTCSNAINSCPG